MATVIATGFLINDPRINEVGRHNDLVANFTVSDTKGVWDPKASKMIYDDREDDRVKTLFHDVSAWRELAEYVEALDLAKGDRVEIMGRGTDVHTFEDRDGEIRASLNVELTGVKKLGGNDEEDEAPRSKKRSTKSASKRSVRDEEDEVEEDEEEAEEKPRSRSTRSTSTRSSRSRKAEDVEEEDEPEEKPRTRAGRGAGRRTSARSF